MIVKFWPKNTGIPVEICNHRFGAKATFSHQTDSRFESSIFAVEMFGFKNNVRLGAFITNLLGQYVGGITQAEKTGLMRHDVYHGTDFWKNPITGVVELIPDYYATVWTSLGASAFQNAIAGQVKVTKTPNHGQQMFDITNGAYGHDYINGVSGASNHSELIGVVENQRSWLKGLTGREISCGSYRNGAQGGYLEHIPLWLAVRNSVPSPSIPGVAGNTFYGFSKGGSLLGLPVGSVMSRQTFITFPSTFRWWDSWNGSGYTKTQATNHFTTQLNLTIANGGWYKDFCHWHSARNEGNLESVDEFLQIFRTIVGSEFVHTCSKGEAVEYLFIRDITSRVIAKEIGSSVVLIADVVDKFKGSFTAGIANGLKLECLNTPLSVKVDLSDTSLSGKILKSNYGKLRSLGSDLYIVEIPFSKKEEGFMSIVIEEGSDGIYNENVPTATLNVNSSTITVNANMKTKAVLFGVTTGGNYIDNLPKERSNEFMTTHVFTKTDGFDYKIGLISEFGHSN